MVYDLEKDAEGRCLGLCSGCGKEIEERGNKVRFGLGFRVKCNLEMGRGDKREKS